MDFKGYLFKDTREFVKLFKERFNYDPDYHNASGIADVAVFKDAIERAGTLDPQKVRAAIAATRLDTIYGTVEFSDNGQIKGTSVVLQIQGGEIYQVFPSGSKSPIYPTPCWGTGNKRRAPLAPGPTRSIPWKTRLNSLFHGNAPAFAGRFPAENPFGSAAWASAGHSRWSSPFPE